MPRSDFHDRIDDLKLRLLDIGGDILDTMQEQSVRRAAIDAAVYGEIAALTCTRMACRRAHRCRGKPLACLKRARKFAAEDARA